MVAEWPGTNSAILGIERTGCPLAASRHWARVIEHAALKMFCEQGLVHLELVGLASHFQSAHCFDVLNAWTSQFGKMRYFFVGVLTRILAH